MANVNNYMDLDIVQEAMENKTQMKTEVLRDLVVEALMGSVSAPAMITRRAAEFGVEQYASRLAKKVTQSLGLRGVERQNVYNKLYENTAKDVAAVPDEVWGLVERLEIKQSLGGPTGRFVPSGKRFPTTGKMELALDNLYPPGLVTHEGGHVRAAMPLDWALKNIKGEEYALARQANMIDNVFGAGGVPEELLPGEKLAYGLMDRFRAQGNKFNFNEAYMDLLKSSVGEGLQHIKASGAVGAKDLYEVLIKMTK